MTTLVNAREVIYQAFNTAWGTTTPLTFDNEQFTPPEGTPWVRLTVRHNVGEQETLGAAPNRVFLRGGSAIVQVFVPLDSGTHTADTLAQTARGVFEGMTLSGLWFLDCVIRELGNNGEGWHQVNVDATFRYQEQK